MICAGSEGDANEDNDGPAADQAAAAAAAPEVARAPPPPGVSPPEVWGDDKMHWRHPLWFVFFLNGPLTNFHPHSGSRAVCEFLKKVPQSGPPINLQQRQIERGDSRRRQRGDDRASDRADTADKNEELLDALRVSRCASSAVL